MYSKRMQSDLTLCAEVAERRQDAAARRARINDNRHQLAKLESCSNDSSDVLQDMINLVDSEENKPAITPLRPLTQEEKTHVVQTLLATPPGSKVRSKKMTELHTKFTNMDDPPHLSPHYRNVWSQWCSACNPHTKSKKHVKKRRGRPRGVTVEDGKENLDDIHGYWFRTGNGSKRHQVRRNANEISHRRTGVGLNLDQMRRQDLIVETNGQVACVHMYVFPPTTHPLYMYARTH